MAIQLEFLEFLYKIKFESEVDLHELQENIQNQELVEKSAEMVIAVQNTLEDSFQKKINLADNIIKTYISYHN